MKENRQDFDIPKYFLRVCVLFFQQYDVRIIMGSFGGTKSRMIFCEVSIIILSLLWILASFHTFQYDNNYHNALSNSLCMCECSGAEEEDGPFRNLLIWVFH